MTDDLHLFSLEDLVRVKKRLLVPLLKDILKASLAHVASCEVRAHLGLLCPQAILDPSGPMMGVLAFISLNAHQP